MANTKGLEPDTGNTIGNLSSNTPLKIDPVSQGDDHIRATKRATQATFPSIGMGTVNLTAENIVQTFERFQIGMITHFVIVSGLVVLPEGWYPCDGNLYLGVIVPNLIDKQIKVSSAAEPSGTQGGLNSQTLVIASVPLVSSQLPQHSHGYSYPMSRDTQTEDHPTSDGEQIVSDTTTTVQLAEVGGDVGGADPAVARPHNHAIELVRDNQPVYLVTLAAIYLGIEEIV